MDKSDSSTKTATLALLLATLLWGSGFTWAKRAGEVANELAGAGHGAIIGPVWVLAVRFISAAILWLIIFPSARRGWSLNYIWRSLILGGSLALGMIVQHLGLDRTSEATSAFLTSLTILFVPILMTFVIKKPPPRAVWFGVILAAAGVWILTGGATAHIGLGELFGLSCAVGYSINIIIVDQFLTRENFMPITAGQFLVLGLICLAICLFIPHGPAALAPTETIRLLSHPAVGINVALMIVFVSMGAFGLQFRYQPCMDPTRAALLYLCEPIFASLYAYIAVGRGMTTHAIIGASLILLANAAAEFLQKRKPQPVAAVID